MKKCIGYKIPYELMCRINYKDLLYMIVDYDIDTINHYLKEKQAIIRRKQGVEIQEATPEMATAFFGGGRT